MRVLGIYSWSFIIISSRRGLVFSAGWLHLRSFAGLSLHLSNLGITRYFFFPYSNYMRILMLIWSIQAGLTPLAIGGLFFFLINFVLAILQIQYVLQQNLAPDYLNVVQSIIEFICTIGTYTGLILCFRRWNSNVSISAPQKLTDDEEIEKESCASSIRSYHSMVYAQQQQQFHYAVPQGAPPSQQVHMFRPW